MAAAFTKLHVQIIRVYIRIWIIIDQQINNGHRLRP